MSINNNFVISRGFIDALEYFQEYRDELIKEWTDQDPREAWTLTYGNLCDRYELLGSDESDQAYADLLALYENDNGEIREGFSFNDQAYYTNFTSTIYDLLIDAIKH